jgi:hypothetical protein
MMTSVCCADGGYRHQSFVCYLILHSFASNKYRFCHSVPLSDFSANLFGQQSKQQSTTVSGRGLTTQSATTYHWQSYTNNKQWTTTTTTTIIMPAHQPAM